MAPARERLPSQKLGWKGKRPTQPLKQSRLGSARASYPALATAVPVAMRPLFKVDTDMNDDELLASVEKHVQSLRALLTGPRHQRQAAEDGIAALMRSVIGIVGFMLPILSSTIASAATIEDVAHCRAVPQLAERLSCFKSLKPGPRAKTEDAAPGKKRDAGSSKVKDAARAKAKQAAPAKSEQAAPTNRDGAAPAKTEQAAPAKTDEAASANRDEAAPAMTEQAAPEQAPPAKTEQAAPANTDEAAPAITETTTKSNTGETSYSSTPDDPATTSSIDRLSVAGQPLCVDAEALAAMILAGLLTSDPTKAATHGCQTLPGARCHCR
jgi:hypothetical protein